MTDVTQDRDQDGAELSAADEQLLRELTQRGLPVVAVGLALAAARLAGASVAGHLVPATAPRLPPRRRCRSRASEAGSSSYRTRPSR